MSEPATFVALFGRAPETTAHAPGRVNLVGEHTDYNGGFVLPTVIPQETTVELAARRDREVHAWSQELTPGAPPEVYHLGDERRGRGWLDYVQGVTKAIADSSAPAAAKLGGFDVRITSTVPVGAGLSSSAALEISLLRALRSRFDLDLDDVQLALLGQRAENDLVGAPVGVMDQLASCLARPGTALFIDTRSLSMERVPMPVGADLVVIDSGYAHEHAGGDYRTRRAECERAAMLLGVASLRDVGPAELERLATLPDVLARRVRHVVSENERVLAAVDAMRADDLGTLGMIFAASHVSMRDDYEVSIPPIDTLVEIAFRDADVIGARLTGGGFGGAIVMLARGGAGAAAAARVSRAYTARLGRRATVLVPPEAGDGGVEWAARPTCDPS